MRVTEFGQAIFLGEHVIIGVDVTVKVRESWKGATPGADIVIHSDVGVCGYPFQFGESYLVWADRRDDALYAHLCGGTKPLDRAGEDLSWLRQSIKK